MKTLLLLRHAKSSREDPGLDDHERPLNKRGKESAKRIGRLLRDEKIVPQVIVSSTAVRARKTAGTVAKQCGYGQAIELDERLYLAATTAHYAVLGAVPADRDRVMLVGHNPGLSDFLNQLTQSSEDVPTAGLALIELPVKRWHEVSEQTHGKLIKLWRPRELSEGG